MYIYVYIYGSRLTEWVLKGVFKFVRHSGAKMLSNFSYITVNRTNKLTLPSVTS